MDEHYMFTSDVLERYKNSRKTLFHWRHSEKMPKGFSCPFLERDLPVTQTAGAHQPFMHGKAQQPKSINRTAPSLPHSISLPIPSSNASGHLKNRAGRNEPLRRSSGNKAISLRHKAYIQAPIPSLQMSALDRAKTTFPFWHRA